MGYVILAAELLELFVFLGAAWLLSYAGQALDAVRARLDASPQQGARGAGVVP